MSKPFISVDEKHRCRSCGTTGFPCCDGCPTPRCRWCGQAPCDGGLPRDPCPPQEHTRARVVHCKREPFDVYIGRPSIWGNPYSHKPSAIAKYHVGSRVEAIERYEERLLLNSQMVAKVKKELRGKVLGCFCAPSPCHGDVLAKIANEV